MSKRTKKWGLVMLLALILLIPVSVQAAAPGKTTVKKLYKEFMEKNTTYAWFRTLDINRDGVKELVVSKSGAKYSGDEYCIYTVKKNSMVYVGSVVESRSFGSPNKKKAIYYNKELKAVRQVQTGTYAVFYTLYKINNYKLQERLNCSGIYNRYRIFSKSYYGKNVTYITETQLNNLVKKYFNKGCTKYLLYSNTASNRASKL